MASMFSAEGKATVIEKLVAFREEKGISQNKLALLSGVPQATISRIERGLQVPQIETIVRLANALEYELEVK